MNLDDHQKNTLKGILDGNEGHKIRTIAGLLGEGGSKEAGEKYDSCVQQLMDEGKSEEEAHKVCQESVKESALSEAMSNGFQRGVKKAGFMDDGESFWENFLPNFEGEEGAVEPGLPMM